METVVGKPLRTQRPRCLQPFKRSWRSLRTGGQQQHQWWVWMARELPPGPTGVIDQEDFLLDLLISLFEHFSLLFFEFAVFRLLQPSLFFPSPKVLPESITGLSSAVCLTQGIAHSHDWELLRVSVKHEGHQTAREQARGSVKRARGGVGLPRADLPAWQWAFFVGPCRGPQGD